MVMCSINDCSQNRYAKNLCRSHYDARRRYERKKQIIEYLGGECTKCGIKQNLQIDHINPDTKSYNITEKILCNFDRIKKELDKCQLLCFEHHWQKTRIDRNLTEKKHGSVNMYVNGGCRCALCKKAWTNYYSPIKKQRRLIQYEKL